MTIAIPAVTRYLFLTTSLTRLLTFFGLLVFAHAVSGQPIRHVGIYVQPYYVSGASEGDPPQVAVAAKFDTRLASTDPATIAQVRDEIMSQPEWITPMTMMVLAIRLYDVGLRDDAVFWFYAAKDRYATVAAVLNVSHPLLAQSRHAVAGFAGTAGYFINGYAFCDLQKQAAARRAAADWVEAHPYQTLFVESFPALSGDRQANLLRAVASIRESVEKERDFVQTPANLERLRTAREESGAVQKYCW
ncbi:hypothetical protein [Caenimonas sp. SL110]|uniref:hypothetical protein n=1 Tax=Caenimonas sp. SL110 TaxID=1450524 RepID=UPI00128E7FC3|nr:hypothetical protein [Caenimonas sp. SL110]